MKVFSYIPAYVFALVLIISGSTRGEDVDLFLGLPGGGTNPPNVLFVIDNTANWSQSGDEDLGPDAGDEKSGDDPVFYIQREAVSRVIRALPEEKVNVGFMLFADTDSDNSNQGNKDGGSVRAAIRTMTEVNKDKYADMIDGLVINDDQANGDAASIVMAEVEAYLSGRLPIAGDYKANTDFAGNEFGRITIGNGNNQTTETLPKQYVWDIDDGNDALPSFPDGIRNRYNPPDFSCKTYIIYLSNGSVNENTQSKRTSRGLLDDLDGPSPIPLTGDFPWDSSSDNPSDEWAKYMSANSGVTTFTIDINRDEQTNSGREWTATLLSMAGDTTRYFAPDARVEDIAKAIQGALVQILAEDSVFASVALPASANTQSTFVNQVYIGQFRPDENALPRWYGNLKQYKLDFETVGSERFLRLFDAKTPAEPAIDSGVNGSGFIRECAQSFWTPGTGDMYWDFLANDKQRGGCTTVANRKVSNSPDGPVVEKGGQAYISRSRTTARTVYTGPSGFCGPTGSGTGSVCSMPLLSSLSDPNDFLVTTTTELDHLIDWMEGIDVNNEDDDTNTYIRQSVHGDVVHSQPIAIDYQGDPNAPEVVVFYGANDGYLRAINGNRDGSHDAGNTSLDIAAGDEFWAFVPPEFYDQVARVEANDPNEPDDYVRFPASTSTPGNVGTQKPYGPDGPITSYFDGTNRYLYFGLRRGGRSIYSINITDADNPTLQWRLGCDASGSCSPGWAGIGETWSPLNFAYVSDGTADGTVPYIVMGGGYDDCEDYDNGDSSSPDNNDCSSTTGNGIYVIDPVSGELIEVLTVSGMRAVPGSVTIVPVSDSNPAIKFAYAVDMGGTVYRISGVNANTTIGTTSPADWTITPIAKVGCDTIDPSCNANRKFAFGPDVVRSVDTASLTEYTVLVGSGEREKPLEDYAAANAVQNYFFAIVDRPLLGDWLDEAVSGGSCGDDVLCLGSFTAVDPNGPLVSGETVGDKGWKMALRSGEQVVSGALTVSDIVNFSTHIPVDPSANVCDSDLGTATTYNVGFDNGEGTTVNINTGGLPPTPVAGKVILDSGEVVPFCIGCGGENSAIGGSQVSSGITWTQPKSRVYWNIQK